MPANYPPIAPRGPNSAPRSDNSFNHETQLVSRETTDDGQADRLAALATAPQGFIDAHHPIRDALTIALKASSGIIKRHALRQRLRSEGASSPAR